MDCDYNDICPICRQLLHHPASAIVCGHAACHVCLLTWIATSKTEPQPLNTSFRIACELNVDCMSLACPICRTETTFSIDATRSSQLELTYPVMYQERAMQNTETESMTIQLGNTHKKVPPSISPFSGMMRHHCWTFFLNSSHADLIDSVDLILHDSFRNHRFITLRKPPFTKSSLGWGYFRIAAFITLHDGWEWESSDAVNSQSKSKGRKDRLPVEWTLDFSGCGSQSLATIAIRRLDTMDEILMSLCRLFTTG